MELQRAFLAGITGAAIGVAAIFGISEPRHATGVAAQSAQAMGTLMDQQGNQVGTVSFTQMQGKTMVQAEVMSLPPGFHGFHVHATGVCDAATAFSSAGGHYQRPGMQHNHAAHNGDMPSLYVNDDGTGTITLTTDRFSIEDLFAGGQRALIVHADQDNFAHIPARYGVEPDEMTLNTGDAGGRLACAVIERTTR
jgi:Cu-Zn family superoxide dismutase